MCQIVESIHRQIAARLFDRRHRCSRRIRDEHRLITEGIRLNRHDVGLCRICRILIAGPDHQLDRHHRAFVLIDQIEHAASKVFNACSDITIRNAVQPCAAQQIYRFICRDIRWEQERSLIVAGSLAVCARICAVQAKRLCCKIFTELYAIVRMPISEIVKLQFGRRIRREYIFSLQRLYCARPCHAG